MPSRRFALVGVASLFGLAGCSAIDLPVGTEPTTIRGFVLQNFDWESNHIVSVIVERAGEVVLWKRIDLAPAAAENEDPTEADDRTLPTFDTPGRYVVHARLDDGRDRETYRLGPGCRRAEINVAPTETGAALDSFIVPCRG